jgi:hypothetical protein
VSFIELNPWRRLINVGVEVVKPRFRIDGGPEGVLASWTPTRIAVEPGMHRVEMWIVWALYKQAGLSAIDVQVPPQGVRVSWRSPTAAFAKGHMTIEAPGTEPFAVAALPTGAPPGAWHPDPSGRHQLRWWDGAAWTADVCDNGVVTRDGP